MARRLRALIERLLPWRDPDAEAKRDDRTRRALADVEQITGVRINDTPGRVGAYDGYRLHRR